MATETTTQTMAATQVQLKRKKDGPTTFGRLSEEIKSLIVESIIRPSDLKNVCLVCKQLHSIAVRFLYRNVALDLGSSHDNRLSAFLSPRNIGLRHIRQLRLYLAGESPKIQQEQQAQFATRMILEFLPEDTLEEFRYANCIRQKRKSDMDGLFWCPWKPFSADNLLLLYQKQRKMKWLEVMDLDRNVLPELKKNAKLQQSLFQDAKKLALYPENRSTLALGGYFTEKCKEQLEELIVHCHWTDMSSIEQREVNDTATEPGLLSRSIFGHMMPFDKCTPFPRLKSLRLHKVSLRHCADTWCKFVQFHDIEHLRLYHCAGADTLLGQLSKSNNLPKSLKVLEIQHKDNSDSEALLALDGFLCLVSGIQQLVVDLENVKSMPAAAGIIRHGKTLELLNIHCAQDHTSNLATDCDTEELVWEMEDFEKICKACKDLEQLSCAWPLTSLIRSPSEEWKSFESSCGHLRDMVTLHISTWPTNKPSTQLLPRAVYECLLQNLALRGFEMAVGTRPLPNSTPRDDESDSGDDLEEAPAPTHDENEPTAPQSEVEAVPPAKLRLVAFGTSEKIYERLDPNNQTIFLRSTSLDANSKPVPHATKIGWCARQFIETRSEVLNFVSLRAGDLARGGDGRMPVSDWEGGGGRVRSGHGIGGGWGDEED